MTLNFQRFAERKKYYELRFYFLTLDNIQVKTDEIFYAIFWLFFSTGNLILKLWK